MQIQKEEIRKSILDAAVDAFYARGYRKASMRDIAHGAGITPGNIYSYFKSKDELFRHVLRDAMQRLDTFISEVFSEEVPREDFMESLADGICELFQENRKTSLILLSGLGGSSYSYIKVQLAGWICNRLKKDFIPQIIKGGNDSLADAMSWAIVEGVTRICASLYDDVQQMRSTIRLFLAMVVGSPLAGCRG